MTSLARIFFSNSLLGAVSRFRSVNAGKRRDSFVEKWLRISPGSSRLNYNRHCAVFGRVEGIAGDYFDLRAARPSGTEQDRVWRSGWCQHFAFISDNCRHERTKLLDGIAVADLSAGRMEKEHVTNLEAL